MTSGSSPCRCCWRSSGRSSRGCSRGRRSAARRRRSSGSRCSLLVGGAMFEFATGHRSTSSSGTRGTSTSSLAHYYGAWVFVASLIARTWRSSCRWSCGPTASAACSRAAARRPRRAVRADGLRAPRARQRPTLSRRGLLGARRRRVGRAARGHRRPDGRRAATAARAARAARRRQRRRGPNASRSTRRAAAAGITPEMIGGGLAARAVGGDQRLDLSRAELLALPQHTHDLPIACVEGWSTTQRWTGVRLADLAALAGAPDALVLRVGVAAGRRRASAGRRSATRRRQRPRAARAAGQRRRPVPRPRLPGADHRPGAARRPLHQVGHASHSPAPEVRRAGLASRGARARVRRIAYALAACSANGRAGRSTVAGLADRRGAAPRPRVPAALLARRPHSEDGRWAGGQPLRVPAVLSGVLLLVYFPLILVEGAGHLPQHRPAAARLPGALAAITAGLFAASASCGRSGPHDLRAASPVTVTPPLPSSTATRVRLAHRRPAP